MDERIEHWLFKTEPSVFSWDDLVAKAASGEEWDGVRNHQARNMMRAMEVGQRGLLYHSQTERAVIGIVEISAAAHPDSTDQTGRWDCVDIRAVGPLSRRIGLSEVKARSDLDGMALVRLPRLSVQPVTAREWETMLEMGSLSG